MNTPPHAQTTAELSLRSVLLGTMLGIVFGASSLYLVLKVGLTVSASIPVAVLSLALFRAAERFGARRASILEHNIVQTAGSAGESLAFGVGVTMPAILILGFDLSLARVLLVTALGGLLGILMMVPLRRALLAPGPESLPFPEGTACAAVLRAGTAEDQAGVRDARLVLTGFSIGLVYKVSVVALRAAKEIVTFRFGTLKGASVAAELSPELLGVGYVIGPRVAGVMCAGGVLAYLVLIPMIQFFGAGLSEPLAPATVLIRDMAPNQIRAAYLLYIGAGAVTAGGVVSLLRALPVIAGGIRKSLADMRGGRTGSEGPARTERDLSPRSVGVGVVLLLAALSLSPSLELGVLGALLVAAFGFLFAAVSARLTGEIGSSSNPVSGMTVATLLFTCLLFLLLGRTGPAHYVCALSVGAIVCIAASNAGGTAQDLKTGQIVGATPRAQQLAILMGALASALALGPILLRLNDAGTVVMPVEKLQQAAIVVHADELTGEEVYAAPDGHTARYRVYQKRDATRGLRGKYLVDPETLRARYFVDPGINGVLTEQADGSRAAKLEAPKAMLMSYIIQGILDGQLPWSLLIFGALIALTLELCRIPSLAFAVGLYLPISSSTPIFVGGLVRAIVERRRAGQPASQSTGEDAGPGMLLSSGYIAGGAIAGIVIAVVASMFAPLNAALERFAVAHNPVFSGPWADGLSLVPFALAALYLLRVARPSAPTGH
jgi:putative OPT family oligopeptide transporter